MAIKKTSKSAKGRLMRKYFDKLVAGKISDETYRDMIKFIKES